jgi:hypothetical protein
MDIDLRFQRAMNRTAFGNFKQPVSLRLIQIADEFDLTIDTV